MPKGDKIIVVTSETLDIDQNGVVDKTDSIRDVEELPTNPASGDLVAKSGKLYLAVEG
jgi:hypothetical protein